LDQSLPLLSIDRLDLSLGGDRLLDGVSFDMFRGECVGLLGRSGSGKSLTARAALGLLPQDAAVSGKIRINGTDVTHMHALSRPKMARAAMVMQDSLSALNPLCTIGYQLEQPLRRRGASRGDARTAAVALLARVGLAPKITLRCSPELSGGQRQRVCIAMALASDAPLIVADEPTTALDVITQAQVLKVLRDVTSAPGGPGLLFITHDLHAAFHLCDRVLVIETGRIVEAGQMAQILAAPRHAYTCRLVTAARRCGIECEALCA